jgi:hypothetical protein
MRYISQGHRLEVSVGFWVGVFIGLCCYFLEKRVGFGRRKGGEAGPRLANRSAVVHFSREFRLPQWLTAGYLSSTGTSLNFSEVHLKALAAFSVTLITYFGIGAWTAVSSYGLAAPCYLSLATTVLVWLFGALTFFFDKYRLPVLLPFALWVWIGSENQKTDHYFRLSAAPEEVRGTDAAEVLASGGYFDNSGLVALSTWLDEGLKDLVANRPSELPTDILVVQILPFPNPSVGGYTGTQHSSFFQAAAPAQTVLEVWKLETSLSQREFSFVVKRWQLEKDHPVNITFVAVAFPQVPGAENPPLSWHLCDKEKALIQRAWTEMTAKSDSVKQITEFFKAQLAKR